MAFRNVSRLLILLIITITIGITLAAPRQRTFSNPPGEFVPSWFVVQLDRPIGEPMPDGSLSLQTGLEQLDGVLRDTGIHRIEMALPVSSRSPADPEAFRRWGFDRTYKFFVPTGTDIPTLVERFSRVQGVGFAEPDYLLRQAQVIPDDPLFDDQWGLHQGNDCDVDAPEGWERSVGLPVIIATVDSGADLDHPDLAAKLWTNPLEIPDNGIDDDGNGYIDDVHGWNVQDDNGFVDDTHGHGTGTASIAIADSDNAEGIAGACWNCQIMLTLADVSVLHFADAMVWATDRGARVINVSQGTATASYHMLNGMGYAYDAGVILVLATGNDNTAVYYPAAYRETIAVGATNALDQWAHPLCGNADLGYVTSILADLCLCSVDFGRFLSMQCRFGPISVHAMSISVHAASIMIDVFLFVGGGPPGSPRGAIC